MTHDFTFCRGCKRRARLTTGLEIYPGRPDLASKSIWICDGCDSYTGCHPGTDRPLGRLANRELRVAKVEAHAAFDPIWRDALTPKGGHKKAARTKAYRWLAVQLGLHVDECHIGYFDVETCRRVIEICKNRNAGRAA